MPSNGLRDSHSDDDYIDDPEVLDPGVFHIWDPLQTPVTLQYTTEQLHSASVSIPFHAMTARLIA
jgi:hypothetical protein